MLYTILIVLLILWLLGMTVFSIGPIIHLLIVVAIIVFIVNALSGRSRV